MVFTRPRRFTIAFQNLVANTLETSLPLATPVLAFLLVSHVRTTSSRPRASSPGTSTPLAFVKSSQCAYGNEPRVYPDLRAQGIQNSDMSSLAFCT